jgi:manganese/zinc/iron transport system permease protein
MTASPLATAFAWSTLDTSMLIISTMVAAACAIPGTFLLLRRLSLMGDAISHAVLPGLVVAFLITGTRDSMPMLVGAMAVGVLSAFLIEFLRRLGKVDESASTGIVFTGLFAVGLILITSFSDQIDLDPGCVLYGNLEVLPLNTIAGTWLPRAMVSIGAVLAFNLLVLGLFYKELKICSFDPGLANTLGFRSGLMHYLLMTMTALSAVVVISR